MKTSVALCTYNGEKYIAEQLESILSQKLPVKEIIICDDGSTDKTLSVLQKFQKQYPSVIKIHRNEKPLGITKNFEKAIGLCTGEIIFLSDQDDIWFPEKTEKIISWFRNHHENAAVIHNLQLYKDGKPENITEWDAISFDEEHRKKENIFAHIFLFDNIITGAAFAFRNTQKFSFPNPKILHDFYLAIQFSARNQLGILDECLGFYRVHDQQQVGTSLEKTAYQKQISRMQDYYYHNTSLPEKIKIIRRGILNLQKFRNDFPEIVAEKTEDLNRELSRTIANYLHTLSWTKRKKTLLSWWKSKKYNITIFDVLFK